MLSRRLLLAIGATAGLMAGTYSASAEEIKEIRIGFQKAGIFPAVKARGTLEAIFKPKGITVKWVEFQFGPPLLEALNTGNVDFGYTGDVPPIFAQAATANLYYTAALPASGKNEAVLVPADSPIKTVADLKGKRIAIAKGSSAHNTAVAALAKANLTLADVTPLYLAPADAATAFSSGQVDAWSIWDPYLALYEAKGARVLIFAGDAHSTSAFFLANRPFTTVHPDIVTLLNQTFANEAKWADSHRPEIAKSLNEATGVELAALTKAIDRSNFAITPVTDEVAANQQIVADRFFKLGLIPKQINVRDIVWKWTPNS
ncbi:aliphatic sulfonate ABC transporter substrate-binding protein [Bradyrhizobium sp.]|uniref:aliphatic sulfonate ABC transporter substrate-binding protein n=1 Tax=Bradyrhizobium sp. TaxID=376 RepID=UPI0039E60DB0